MMRVVTEPPPPGAPENSPSRNFLKAWDEANARTKDTTIAADVITYDSQNDLIYAKGEGGRLVQIVAANRARPAGLAVAGRSGAS